MPSFTFVSTANAFVLRGGVPVFVDIRADTLNIDERAIEAALTPRTRAIVPVHYAGVALRDGRDRSPSRAAHGLLVIEDAAQALGSTYRAAPLGRFGDLAAISFHETKNVIVGRGRRAAVNDAGRSPSGPRSSARRAPIAAASSAVRSTSTPGSTSGSSFVPSELDGRVPLGADGGRGRDHRAAPRDLALVLRRVRGARAPGTSAAAHRPRTLRAQRPHVLRRSSRMARRERGCSLY